MGKHGKDAKIGWGGGAEEVRASVSPEGWMEIAGQRGRVCSGQSGPAEVNRRALWITGVVPYSWSAAEHPCFHLSGRVSGASRINAE